MELLKEFTGILMPLLIIMDPVGILPFFMLFTRDRTAGEKTRTAAIACVTAGLILFFFALTGDAVLRFFDIGLPAFQLAGGFIFFIYSLQMLQLIPLGIKTTEEEEQEGIAKDNVALVPLATPLLAGPGAITVVMVWRQSPGHLVSLPTLLAVIGAASLVVFGVFFAGQWIVKVLGLGGIRVLTRLMGLLLAVIAVQLMVNGLQALKLAG